MCINKFGLPVYSGAWRYSCYNEHAEIPHCMFHYRTTFNSENKVFLIVGKGKRVHAFEYPEYVGIRNPFTESRLMVISGIGCYLFYSAAKLSLQGKGFVFKVTESRKLVVGRCSPECWNSMVSCVSSE